MNAGTLDRLVQFQRATLTDDGFGMVESFVNHGAAVWAKKTDLSDGERLRASEVSASITTRFLVRWSSFTAVLTPKDRLVCEGRDYNIFGIKEGTGRRKWLEVTAAARVDQ